MKNNVAYFYSNDVGNYHYGPNHPMKPQRIKLAHHLLVGYGLYHKMEVYKPHIASYEELSKFHGDDYVEFLSKVSSLPANSITSQMHKFSIGDRTDNPIFDGMYDFCKKYTGASIDAAIRINHKLNDICINWSGGLHHAKKTEASGFCYVNDIVIAILELLKYHARVMYIDIDIHHGDGVEEAFYTNNRVMTISFHKYGDFFPGTGRIDEIGVGNGKKYAINVPLNDFITDEVYQSIFEPVVEEAINRFEPGVIILQCGADSITGDRLGCFNMSLHGHGNCVKFVKSFGIPMMLLGGGGYTMKNVSRCWCYETSLVLGEDLNNAIPYNEFIEWYSPNYELHLIPDENKINLNDPKDLDKKRIEIFENIKDLERCPSVAFHHVPEDWIKIEEDVDEYNEIDKKDGIDSHVRHESEFYNNECDHDHNDVNT